MVRADFFPVTSLPRQVHLDLTWEEREGFYKSVSSLGSTSDALSGLVLERLVAMLVSWRKKNRSIRRNRLRESEIQKKLELKPT